MITPSLARMLAQEHVYKPITGKVLCLGRQLITMTHAEAIDILRAEGMKISDAVIKATAGSVETKNRFSDGKQFITDYAFFQLFGINDVRSMDVTDYEGAEVVHNLNYKIPDELRGKFDFIIDGGTFDHLIDIKVCFENVVNLLSVGGRVFQWNAASNYVGAAYLSFGPDFFRDYYIVNNFSDCKVYIAEADCMGQMADWDIYYLDKPEKLASYTSGRYQMVLVVAEKAADSTAEKIPVQLQYRPAKDAAEFAEGERRVKNSSRPVWQGRTPVANAVEAPPSPPARPLYRRVLSRLKRAILNTTPEQTQSRPTEDSNRKAPRKGFSYQGKL